MSDSGVSRSGAGCIIHAGGGIGVVCCTTGSDVHPLRITLSITTQPVNFALGTG
ncbi:MAG TPA: hypothetical protein K8V18_02895 [Proteus mirabilis]|nr:hypothetical protein [Proteus mirabilis]MCB4836363.1 hypothetical protein [Proteus mirabilis]MCB6147418.1 hypothetical protein [Proteus mirabilis]HJF23919.1 hypothetical protein [Proteus mirabilis]